MADINQSNWSEVDSSNNSASPNGWTSGTMTPSQVEPTARAMMGAIKRFYDHINGVKTSAGTANAQTLTYDVAPAALVTGDRFMFKAGATNTGAATLNINSLGATTIHTREGAALIGGEILTGEYVEVVYDGTNLRLVGNVTTPLSWTPGIDFGGGTTGITYSLQAGSYTKVGKLIIAQFAITLTSKGSSTGAAHLTGLPVTSAATANLIGMVTLTGGSNFSVAGATAVAAQIGAGATTAAFNVWNGGSTGSLTDVNFNNNTALNGTAIYVSA